MNILHNKSFNYAPIGAGRANSAPIKLALAALIVMINIRTVESVPITRPCDFMLGMQDDSVFADFNINKDGCLYLVRISYDGYGCCHLDPKLNRGTISKEDSEVLITCIKANEFGEEVSNILSSYLNSNKSVIIEEALIEHELI